MRRIVIAVLMVAGIAAPLFAAEPSYLNPGEVNPKRPFSQAVLWNDTLYLSGSIGIKPGERAVVPGGIQAETRQTMDNIKATLERYGSSLDRVLKCTVFLADMGEWPAMNEIYVGYFPNHKPARSALGASGLALNARVEIECIAAAGEG